MGSHPNLSCVQADLYSLPFRPGSFDFVYCFGVLQHTPDVKGAFTAVCEQVREGGRLAVDVYAKNPLNWVWPKYWLRTITKRMEAERLFELVRGMVAVLLPVSFALGRVPLLGRKLRHVVPVANYRGVYPLTEEQLREWAILDTFDMLAPAYDQPQTMQTVKGWFEGAGFELIEVIRRGLVVGRGVKSPLRVQGSPKAGRQDHEIGRR
jgi:SAM-dependent methyltransferase